MGAGVACDICFWMQARCDTKMEVKAEVFLLAKV
jgi:hypothetical protein